MNLNNQNRVNAVWGNGLWFNGTNSYIAIGNNLGGDFTLSFWIKSTQVFPQTESTPAGTGLLWSDVGGNANDFVVGGTRNAAGTNRVSFFTGNPGSSLHGTREISNGKWTHLAVVRRQTTGERRLFVNGLLDGVSNGGTNLLTANPAIHIGGNTLDGRYFLGLMDEVRAYNRALSDPEVAALAAAGGYESWAAATMPATPAELLSRTADPDGDEQLNLLEFAFDTDPLTADAAPFQMIRGMDGSPWLSYVRRTGFSGLRCTIWKSEDLVTWSPIPEGYLEEQTEPVPGKSVEIVTGRVINALGSAYFRLGVTAIEP